MCVARATRTHACLEDNGALRIFEGTVSDAKADRIDLAALMNVLRAVDAIIILRLGQQFKENQAAL